MMLFCCGFPFYAWLRIELCSRFGSCCFFLPFLFSASSEGKFYVCSRLNDLNIHETACYYCLPFQMLLPSLPYIYCFTLTPMSVHEMDTSFSYFLPIFVLLTFPFLIIYNGVNTAHTVLLMFFFDSRSHSLATLVMCRHETGRRFFSLLIQRSFFLGHQRKRPM